MNFFKKKLLVATHNGTFHADECFACATLSVWAQKNGQKIKIVRTRDPEIIKRANIVVDVGMEYDSRRNRFDHHQLGGAGEHENGIPHASFGLVWQKYGEEICGSKEVAKEIERRLVIPIDAHDNGINIMMPNGFGTVDYIVSFVISTFNATWIEGQKDQDKRFMKALSFATQLIEREITRLHALEKGKLVTQESIEKQNGEEILILDMPVDWEEVVVGYPYIKIVIYPGGNGDDWSVQVARDDIHNYDSNRVNFPDNWRGLRGEELEAVSGVVGSIFCTRGGWFMKVKTKEGAIELAKKALKKE